MCAGTFQSSGSAVATVPPASRVSIPRRHARSESDVARSFRLRSLIHFEIHTFGLRRHTWLHSSDLCEPQL